MHFNNKPSPTSNLQPRTPTFGKLHAQNPKGDHWYRLSASRKKQSVIFPNGNKKNKKTKSTSTNDRLRFNELENSTSHQSVWSSIAKRFRKRKNYSATIRAVSANMLIERTYISYIYIQTCVCFCFSIRQFNSTIIFRTPWVFRAVSQWWMTLLIGFC